MKARPLQLNPVFDASEVEFKKRGVRAAIIAGGAVLMLLSPRVGSACSCRVSLFFHEAMQQAELAVSAEVVEVAAAKELFPGIAAPPSMRVRIVTTHRGVARSKEVRVWGGFGMDCLVVLAPFKKGSYWALALERVGEERVGGAHLVDASPDDYALYTCGENWRPLRDEEAARKPLAHDAFP